MTNLKGNNFVIFFRFFCFYFNRKLVVISCRSTISTRLVCSSLVTLHVHVISMLLQNYYVSMAYILLPILTFWKSSIFSLLGEFSLVCIRNIAIITNALAKMKRYKHHITKSISRQPCVMRTGFCLDISKTRPQIPVTLLYENTKLFNSVVTADTSTFVHALCTVCGVSRNWAFTQNVYAELPSRSV